MVDPEVAVFASDNGVGQYIKEVLGDDADAVDVAGQAEGVILEVLVADGLEAANGGQAAIERAADGLETGVGGCGMGRLVLGVVTMAVLGMGHGLGAAEMGVLEVSVAEAGAVAPARVRVRDAQGVDRVPAGAVVVPIGPDKWFACMGRARLDVAVGQVSIRIERGTEYRPIIETVQVAGGQTVRRQIELHRWIDMKARGYVSGENHLHVRADDLGPMLAAEGLDFGTSLSWWNGPNLDVPPGEAWARELACGDGRCCASVYDAEVEHSWGAVYLVGLRRPMAIRSDGRRSNLPFVREARRQGALVCYQGGWSREVLIDALLGCVDVVNVCNNNFHRHKYQPRSRYSNLLGVEGFEQYPDTPEGMIRMNFETYYRLLNCGLRLASGAGSATGAKSTPIGYNRAYVRAGDNPTIESFLEAWRAGRNFVTNGPMLFLRTAAGAQPGDTIALPADGGTVRVEVEALSEQPLQSLEIVFNGRVAGRAVIPSDAHRATLSLDVPVTQGAWLAARCVERDMLLPDEHLSAYTKGGGTPEQPCRLRFAHTSPIYVTVNGRGAQVEHSIAEARKMLEAFEQFARKTTSTENLQEILDAIDQIRTTEMADAY